MRAYVVFTRIRTRDPAELAQYTAQAPAFVAGHTLERLANFGACAVLEGLGGQTSPLPTAGQRFPPIASPPDSGFRDVANLHHRAKHSRHHTKDKQRFVVSVVAYDSLPGHQCYDIPRFSTTLYDATPVRERDVVRQLIDRSTLHWRSLVTWRGLIRRMSGYGMTPCGAKRPLAKLLTSPSATIGHYRAQHARK
jgi:hypothetical protein